MVIAGLSHTYRRRRVLDGVDAAFGPGVLGLLGPNGAGKTTLLRLLAGVLRPRSGRVEALGHDLRTRAGRRALRRDLGYLPQETRLPPDMSPRDFLDYIGLLKGMPDPRERAHQAEDLIRRLGLAEEADRRMGTLSAGARRRTGAAQALMGRPRLVVLDEPTAGLDPEERVRLRTLLASLDDACTVIVSTHLLDDVKALSPEIAVLARGRMVFSGPPGDLVADAPRPDARSGRPSLEEGYAALMRTVREEE
ncbi:ATP-binding cassette domain-containing protein [Nocardiopsis sp. RSe5-2]|uniref:ATP-binding cassette domain-containing protein n=1 Tax=Nocardiopsis endophytica TaxID=3018445 RepID=A0ABT4UC12_9ACTN|nr:ATP-binding cassette domain-containing protein [Nocardiopsis endophytica]MDA2814525.1 ATP-binding cassette domain-containing protein [Nocardiopsis endophytica]